MTAPDITAGRPDPYLVDVCAGLLHPSLVTLYRVEQAQAARLECPIATCEWRMLIHDHEQRDHGRLDAARRAVEALSTHMRGAHFLVDIETAGKAVDEAQEAGRIEGRAEPRSATAHDALQLIGAYVRGEVL